MRCQRDLVPLAGDCMRAWRQFLADHNLDPLSLSPPQATLAAALRERGIVPDRVPPRE